jgi:AcrR family transcriptional regulator
VTTKKASQPPVVDRRQALVAAAYHQIAQRGFEGLRTREVAAEVGVNVATLHYYFPSKETLIRGVLVHAMQRFRSTLPGAGAPADQLRSNFAGVRRLVRTEPELFAVMGELALPRALPADDRRVAGRDARSAEQGAGRRLARRAPRRGRPSVAHRRVDDGRLHDPALPAGAPPRHDCRARTLAGAAVTNLEVLRDVVDELTTSRLVVPAR